MCCAGTVGWCCAALNRCPSRSATSSATRQESALKQTPALICAFLEETAAQLYELCPATVRQQPPEPQTPRVPPPVIGSSGPLYSGTPGSAPGGGARRPRPASRQLRGCTS